ncbi:unnamed protein product [Coregonus sp. 'balchen']|nr:unnamed protein product [Coregonus sp. 'balchen']
MAMDCIGSSDAFKLGILGSIVRRSLDAPRHTVLARLRTAPPDGRQLTPPPRMTVRERLREKISAAFYRHGLLCASYPVPIILFTSASILACCYPLLRLPLPGTGPVEFTTRVRDYTVPSHEPQGDLGERPDWYQGPPVAYIQQVLVKAAVSPWDSTLVPVDVFRSPLGRVFSLLEEIRNHVHNDGSGVRSLEALCLQVTDLLPGLRRMQTVLPEHGCLLVSPGNYWQNQRELFDSDPDLLKTVHQHEPKGLHTSATLRDLLFGVPGKHTGVSLYSRKKVVTYTITMVLGSYDTRFLSSLRARLRQLHPSVNCSLRDDHMVHVHFKEEIGVAELIPLVTTYIILFAYIYFSTRKIDMVKSKWGLALAAVVTVLSSLLMSVGLCTLFGLTPTLNGGEIFPYLVVVIGLENVLVLTKSVVSTPLADLNRRLPAEAGMPPPKPGPLRPREAPPPPRPSPHTITLQTPAFRNLRLPKRLRVVYFLARTLIWIGILAYTDPAGLRTYLATQVSEQSPLGEGGAGGLPPNLGSSLDQEGTPPAPSVSSPPRLNPPRFQRTSPRATMGPPGKEYPTRPSPHPWCPRSAGGRRMRRAGGGLSFRHWPSLFSYYNITLAKRYISILPVIPVTLHLSPREAIETRHPQDTRHPPPPTLKTNDLPADLTLYKVAALGLAAGVLLVLLLFCLYRVLCPRNYGQNGVAHGRRRRGDLPCDDYGYSPPISEISPLLLRGHSMQRDGWDAVGVAEPENLGSGTEPGGGVFDEDEGYPLRRRSTPRPALFEDQPDLTPLIDTNFDSQPPSHLLLTPPRDGFDFGGLVERAYLEHEPPASYPSPSPPSGPAPQRRRSLGYIQPPAPQGQGTPDWESAVWAMELRGNLIAAGRSSGKLELWDAVEGSLRCSNEDGVSGITALAFLNNRIVAARLNGSLDFFTVDINKPLGLLQYRGPPGRW